MLTVCIKFNDGVEETYSNYKLSMKFECDFLALAYLETDGSATSLFFNTADIKKIVVGRTKQNTMETYNETFYFTTREAAKDWATRNGWPTVFIREYQRGFAVQARDNGSYAGPDFLKWS